MDAGDLIEILGEAILAIFDVESNSNKRLLVGLISFFAIMGIIAAIVYL